MQPLPQIYKTRAVTDNLEYWAFSQSTLGLMWHNFVGGSGWPSDYKPNALLKTCPLNTPASDHSNILCKNLCGTFTDDILIASNYKFDYEVRFNSESGWCSITVLIKRTDDSPQSCTRMFDLSSSRRNGKWSDPPGPHSLCQQLWPSLSVWQQLLKDIPFGWQCTSCLPSLRQWLPRCERSACSADTWWSRGIDGARNDEEMRDVDGQAVKMAVNFVWRARWASN